MEFEASYDPSSREMTFLLESAEQSASYYQIKDPVAGTISILFTDKDGEVFEFLCEEAFCEFSGELSSGWKIDLSLEDANEPVTSRLRKFTDPDGL